MGFPANAAGKSITGRPRQRHGDAIKDNPCYMLMEQLLFFQEEFPSARQAKEKIKTLEGSSSTLVPREGH